MKGNTYCFDSQLEMKGDLTFDSRFCMGVWGSSVLITVYSEECAWITPVSEEAITPSPQHYMTIIHWHEPTVHRQRNTFIPNYTSFRRAVGSPVLNHEKNNMYLWMFFRFCFYNLKATEVKLKKLLKIDIAYFWWRRKLCRCAF